jgi:transposase
MGKSKKKRDEGLYNIAQENELLIFLDCLPEAVRKAVRQDDLWRCHGRPPKDLYDILACLCIQRFVGVSTRRSMGWIRVLNLFGRLGIDVPSWRTLARARANPEIKPYLDSLHEVTTRPYKKIEHDFSTDASGVRTKCFSTWYSLRCNKRIRKRDHMESHVTTGRRTHAAFAVNTEVQHGKDSEYMREHIKRIARKFLINDWSGDSKYLSRANCDAVRAADGEPWFRLKKNTTRKPKGSQAWKDMVNEFRKNPRRAKYHYHKRSQSESTFSSKKRKFGDGVRSKLDSARENEDHLAWTAHNFSMLSNAKYMLKAKLKF